MENLLAEFPIDTGESLVAERLDRFGSLAAELALARDQLLHLARTQDHHAQALGALAGPLQRLSRITADLQAEVREARIQPMRAPCRPA